MESKFKRKGLMKIVVLMLVCTIMATSALTGFLMLPGIGKGPAVSDADTGIVKGDTVDHSAALENLNEDLVTKTKAISDDEMVYYIIEAGKTSLLTMFENRSDKSVSYQDFVSTRSSRMNAENMTKKQKAIFGQIGKKVDVKFAMSLTGMANAFAVSVRYGDRQALKEAAFANGALSVTISERYDQPQFVEVNNTVPAYDTGIFKGPESHPEYQGQGMVIAVLDTSLDYTHDAFQDDGWHLPSSDNDVTVDETKLKIDRDYIAEKLPLLAANGNYERVVEGVDVESNLYSKMLDVSDVYMNRKIPYAYDYADWDTDVNATQENSHGTHVAGIMAGRSKDPVLRDKYGDPILDNNGQTQKVKDPTKPNDPNAFLTGIEGVAPRAQIVAMKVFSDFRGGAEDIFLYGALEDCARLGVDVVNLSLGRGSGFSDMEDNPIQRSSYKLIDQVGINLITAAGNGYGSAMGGYFGTNLTTNPDSATVGTPSTMYESFSVASINGVKSKYIKAMEYDGTAKAAAYIHESNDAGVTTLDFIADLTEAVKGTNADKIKYSDRDAYTKANGTKVKYLEGDTISIPFVVIPGYGRDSDYSNKDVSGKIVVMSRGVNTFIDKMVAARRQGALGAVVYNNAGGLISMSLDKNEVVFPSCSISMDASIPLIEMGEGVFEISVNLAAGPFMSAFSSWGPLPSLELKPDITGHGGEIYSSYPGNNYNRISGTSMAAPNIAGLMILARQHIKANAAGYGVSGDGSEEDNKKIQVLTYRLMMSTATMPLNEDGNPYSPRKMGAGLANIGGMIDSKAYIITKDKRTGEEQDRTKLELFDDPTRSGVYTMEFTIRNISSDELKYNLKSFAFTEGVASDNKVVAEKARMFEGPTKWWKKVSTDNYAEITNSVAVAAPNTDTVIKAEIKLSPNDKAYLEKTVERFVYDENGDYMRDKNGQLVRETVKLFENGMFVEGFLRLDGIKQGDKTPVNLGVPFLGYYGDWNEAPMFEPSIYDVDKDAKNLNKNEEAKIHAQARPLQAYGKLTSNGWDYTLPLGQFLFAVPEYSLNNPMYEIPYSTEDRTTLSLSQSSLYELYFVAGFLRGAKYAHWEIRDKYTGELMDDGLKVNLRKDARASNIGGVQMELDVGSVGCMNGGTYVYSFSAILDHYADYQLSDRYLGRIPTWAELTHKTNGAKGKIESWSFEFTIDTDAPIITDTELRVVEDISGDHFNYFLDFYIHDDNYVQAMSFNLYDVKSNDYKSVWEKGIRPILCEKNGTTRVTYDITNGWEHLVKNEYKISTQVYDYAWNMSHYDIDLKKILYKTAETTLEFGDIGQYREYTRGDSKYTVMESHYDEVIIKADGTYDKMSKIYVVKNQTINLSNALVTDENVWPESFTWSTDKRDYLTVNAKTGEIFVKASDSTEDIMATVTVAAYDRKMNTTTQKWERVKVKEKSIEIVIVSDKNVGDYNISTINANVKNLSSVSFVEISKDVLDAGEAYEVKIEAKPWFGDTTDLVVDWSIEDENVATISKNVSNQFEAVVTARQGVRRGGKLPDGTTATDEYTPNESKTTVIIATVYHKDTPYNSKTARFGIYVLPEFVVNGTLLVAYNGTRSDVVIPESLGIKTISDRCFINNSTIESLVLPEGVEVIQEAAFAYCSNLKSVKMPSTLRTIGEYAFTGSFTPRDGLNTSLQVVDTTACKEPIQIEPKAFINNATLNTNTTIKRTGYTIQPSTPDFKLLVGADNKLDMLNFRVVGERAFSGAGFVTELNLVNCRTMGEAAFSGAGRWAVHTKDGDIDSNQSTHTTITLGERTGTALSSLAQTGVEELVVPMSRVAESAFTSSPYLETIKFTGVNIYIGDSAFSSCPKLNKVEFKTGETFNRGPSVTYDGGDVAYIGKNAFSGNGALTTLNFEGKAKYIDDYAFFGAPLAAIRDLPEGLEYLGTDAFSGRLNADGDTNSNIETLNIPLNFNTNIENFGAFFNTKFSQITIGGLPTGSTTDTAAVATASTAEKVQYYLQDGILLKNQIVDGNPVTVMVMTPFLKENFTAFDGGSGEFKVPDAVTVLGENAFGFNSEITHIDLNNVEIAMPGAMQNMKSLVEVTLSDDMTEIPDYMFRGCTSLTAVNNTDQVTKIGKYAFAGNVDQIYVAKDGSTYKEVTATTAGAFAVTAIEIVPITTIDLSSCIEIGEGAFSATGLTTVELFLGVTEIPAHAFAYSLSLETANFQQSVESIGDFAFYMTGLESVVDDLFVPRTLNVTEIGNSAFAFDEYEIYDRTAKSLLNGLESKLAEVSFPNATIVGSGAFSAYYGGGALTSVSLPKVQAIGAYAFEYQSELNITDLTKLEVVGNYAFAGTGMKAVNMPKVEYIGTGAFYDCVDMKGKITIPATAEYIGPLAFAYTEITEFAVAGGSHYKAINGVLFRLFEKNSNALELAHYPAGNGRRDINGGIPVGNGISGMTSGVYVVPEGTTRIGANAFTTVKTVGTVILPSTLTHIGDKAFFGSLVKVYEFKSYRAPVLESGADSFDYEDINDYTWAVYANFYNYFSPTSSYYTWTSGAYMTNDTPPVPIVLKSFLYQFRYNTITIKSSSNGWVYGEYIYSDRDATPLSKAVPDTDTQNAHFGANNSITGGGDLTDRYQYGLVIVRPTNGAGYDDFVYKYYFDSVILSAPLMTDDIQEVIDMIDALPAAGEITLENLGSSRVAVAGARNYYNYLRDDVKELVHNYQKLVDCETAISTILASIKTYTVAFQADGALVGKIQTIEAGGKVVMPANPTPATGYAFDGWYFGDQKFDANTAVNQDMILTARWVVAENYFKVTFGGIGVNIESQIVENETRATKPEDPVREGYKFKGWVSEDGKFNFNSAVTKDIDLYAEWEKKGGCGCSCGSISLDSGTGLLVVLISVSAMLALSGAVLIKKRTISKATKN